jgi:hypothetical protein
MGDSYSGGSGPQTEWEKYMQYNGGGGLSTGYGGGEFWQGAYNTLSNPFGAIMHMANTGGKGNLASNFGGGAQGLTNPLGVNFTSKYGAFNGDMTEDVFNSMTDDDWATFKALPQNQQSAYILKRRQDIAAGKVAANAEQERVRKEQEYQAWRQQTMVRLDEFSKKMGMSVEELIKAGDAGVIAARNDAASMSGRQGLGLTGGVSAANTERAVADAAMRYQLQRQQMGAQATEGLLGQLNTQYLNDEDRRRYEQNMNLQLQSANGAAMAAKYAQAQQQQAGLMGMAGTVLGGIWGGAEGAKAGGQIGPAFGTYQYGNSNPYQPYQYQYPSGTGARQGLGSTRNNTGGYNPLGGQ